MTPDAELVLELDVPQRITVVSCRLVEGISKLTHARLEIAANDHIDLTGVLERDAVIDLAPIGFPPRRWTLRVGHVDFIKITEGSLRYVVNLYPAFWLLRFTTNTRKFRNMSSQQIITQVLDQNGVDHRFELTRPTETRKYCGQYRETNLDFVHRLLEFEGIYYWFEPDGTMVMQDRSEDSPPTDGKAMFDLVEAAGAMQWESIGIWAFRRGRTLASGKATVNDFNWKKPAVKLLKEKAADEDDELEIYDYPVGYRREDQGERLARHRLEAYRVPSRYVEGSSNVTSFQPARSFAFGVMAGPRFAGDFVLTEVDHDYINRKFAETLDGAVDEVNYRNHFKAIPKQVPFRPPLVTPHPHIAGCHTAMCVGPEGEEIHTDQHGRFRAKFHWDREAVGNDEDSRWLRNTQEVATGMALSRVGWEQSIAYINGDPDRPFGFARNINGQMVPEYAQPVNKTRLSVKTPTYPGKQGFNELRMEDIAGKQHMDWHAEKDMFGEVGRDRSEHVEGNEDVKIGESYAWTVGNNQTFEIGGNFDCSLEKNYSFNVTNDRKKTVTGNEEFKITEVFAYSIENNDTEEVGAERKILAAEQSGSITRQTETHWKRDVTGDVQVEGTGNLEIIVQDTLTETVGTDKTITCEEGGISVRVGGVFTINVDGAATRESTESQGYSANQSTIVVKGDAALNGDEKININGDRIILQADQLLGFQSQALQLKLEPGKTTIGGKMKIDAGGNIVVSGNSNNITQETMVDALVRNISAIGEAMIHAIKNK